MKRINSSAPIAERLERRIERIPFSGCWIWLGATDSHGYGGVSYNQGRKPAHRVSFETYVGPIPANYQVCHRCDVRCCVNPAHLFVGTALDNARDMITKGRDRKATGAARGAKLTESQVVELRTSSEKTAELARRLGIAYTTAFNARYSRTWRHLK